MTEFSIRPLSAEDRDQWLVLWKGYLTFYEEELPDQVTDHVWGKLLESTIDPNGFAAVAEGSDKLIGFTHYLFHSTTWSMMPTCYLEDLFVSENIRGGGVGRALIDAVAKAARAKGCETLYWKTQTGNARARRLYDDVATLSDFVIYEQKLGR